MPHKYSVIILKEDKDQEYHDYKRFFVPNLELARSVFSYHAKFLSWSRQHKENMGLQPNDHGKVWLYDHGCRYELEEANF